MSKVRPWVTNICNLCYGLFYQRYQLGASHLPGAVALWYTTSCIVRRFPFLLNFVCYQHSFWFSTNWEMSGITVLLNDTS